MANREDDTPTAEELVEELRRIGRLDEWPTYNFAKTLYQSADCIEGIRAKQAEAVREAAKGPGVDEVSRGCLNTHADALERGEA